MSMSNAAEAAAWNLLFLNTNWANIGDATGLRGSTTAGSLYIRLHSSDPGEAGTQTTNEIAYTDYDAAVVPRSGSGFTLTGSTISNAALVQFPLCTGGSATATHWSIGDSDFPTAGVILVKGALASSLSISNGIRPQFEIGALTATLD